MYEKLLEKQLQSDLYYTKEDLRMNRKHSILLSSKELNEYLSFKENIDHPDKIVLPLKSFNSKQIYYFNTCELLYSLSDYVYYFKENYDIQKSFKKEIDIGIICSELEGTLKIEGVNTTRRQIETIIKTKDIKTSNDQIILNMYNALEYLYTKPEFTKDNLYHLYQLLSYHSLTNDLQLKDNNFYRDDAVYISEHEGCPKDLIDECMNSLFEYVGNKLDDYKKSLSSSYLILPYIAHYYMLYIHPYFDFNGRTARMVQIWIYLLLDYNPILYLSEAINGQKTKYYKAIEESRTTHNDLTYFLIYLTKLSNDYYVVFKNLEEIKKNIEASGDSITTLELHYFKRILLNSNLKWFNYKAFMNFSGLECTKQGSLKILNTLEKKGLLLSRINASKEKIYTINEELITYELN